MTSWRDAAKRILTKDEQKRMRASFDVIGDIAIIEIAKGLEKKEKQLASALLRLHPPIKVVAKKVGARVGKYRGQKLKLLAGEKRFETTHVESGLRMKLNVQSCYFSPRLSTERLRVAKLVKKGEKVLVLFSGVAPFPLVIAKHAKPSFIDAVELNPAAHKSAKENIIMNKKNNTIFLFNCDAKAFLKKTRTRYDRVLLAWPGHADDYIMPALRVLKKGGALHFYDFTHADALNHSVEKVRKACPKCKIKKPVICGQQKPRVHRVCVDARR